MTEPHYLRFARSLALVSSLGCASFGCGTAMAPPTDAGSSGTDVGSTGTDTGTPMADAGPDCTSCTCGLTADDAGLPFCAGDLIIACNCAAVGPLAPPDLAA